MAQEVQKNIQIGVSINGVELNVSPSSYSFVMTDTIYNILNRAVLTLNDTTGLLQESLVLAKGTEVEITFGKRQRVDIQNYRAWRKQLVELNSSGVIAGGVDLFLINSWYEDQVLQSRAFEDTISSIVTTLINLGPFSDSRIDATDGAIIWYQPLMTDVDFIKKILLPNAFAYNADGTPFYAYATSDGVFNFRHAKSLYNESIVAELNFQTNDTIQGMSNATVGGLQEVNNKDDLTIAMRNREIFRLNRDDGSLSTEEELITDYVRRNRRVIPILGNMDEPRSFFELEYSENDVARENNVQGRIADSRRNGIFIDRFSVVIPYNPNIHAGDKVQFNVHNASDRKREQLSNRYSGEYVVEVCEHSWNGEALRANTSLTIGRKYVDLPNTYLLKSKTLRG